jgi:PIN domain nuclease of toxin-antitoxin system
MSYLLDSSAWLAHLFGEPGMEDVNLLFSDSKDDVSISALSLPEVYGRPVAGTGATRALADRVGALCSTVHRGHSRR